MAAAARRGLPLVSGPSTSRALPSLPEGGEAAGGSVGRERSREDGGGLTGRAGWTASQGAGAPSSTSSIASEWGGHLQRQGGAPLLVRRTHSVSCESYLPRQSRK